jgi:hypothetical protein
MEKLDYLVWRDDGVDATEYRSLLLEQAAPAIAAAAGVRSLTVYLADTDADVPTPTLLMGRGSDLAAVVSLWVDSYDDRNLIEEAIAAVAGSFDGYLVTESVPQARDGRDWPDGRQSPGITHFTWFPKPDRLTDAEFYRGWHVLHTPASAILHPLRWSYVRDAAVRPITVGSPPLGAIVFESFRLLEDYTDPDRLYGSSEALAETMEHLPLYADFETLNSRPLHEVVVRSL